MSDVFGNLEDEEKLWVSSGIYNGDRMLEQGYQRVLQLFVGTAWNALGIWYGKPTGWADVRQFH